jgi:hypothetical protein
VRACYAALRMQQSVRAYADEVFQARRAPQGYLDVDEEADRLLTLPGPHAIVGGPESRPARGE